MSYLSDNLDDDDPVWVTSSTSALCLHVDPHCLNLKRAQTVHERSASMYPDQTKVCKQCTGRAKKSRDYSRGYYRALKDAAQSDD